MRFQPSVVIAVLAIGAGCVPRSYNSTNVNIANGRTLESDPALFSEGAFSLPVWSYFCTYSEPIEPDLCTGSLLAGGKFVMTAHHCVKSRVNRFPVTAVVARRAKTDKHTPPSWEAVCKSDAPLEGFVRVPEFFVTESTSPGADMSILRLAEPLEGPSIAFGDPRTLSARETISIFGYGFSDCDTDPKHAGTTGNSIIRSATFDIDHLDEGMSAIYLRPDGSGAMSCATDSGMGYLVKRDGKFALVGIHRGKPNAAEPLMYGSLVDSRHACGLFAKAGIQTSFCPQR